MKLSENTLAILKNFGTINAGIVLNPGNELAAISFTKTIMGVAKIPETLPTTFGIYDISRFLGNVSQLGGPDADFDFVDSTKVVITSPSGFSIDYYGAAPNLIQSPSGRLPDFTPSVTFDLTNDALSMMGRIAGLNDLEFLSVSGSGNDMMMKAYKESTGNEISNSAKFRIGDNPGGADFNVVFKIENLKLLPVDYTVDVNSPTFAKFKTKSGDIEYFISLQSQEK